MRKDVVVDCNVPVVANGKGTHVSWDCQTSCITELKRIVHEDRVVLDEGGLIFKEYQGRLNFSGQPGIGHMFFKHLFDHQYNYDRKRVSRVKITPSDADRGFMELLPNGLDPADRKFLAVAVVAQAPILNATDSDWNENAGLLDNLGVTVVQLCPEYADKA